MPRKEESIERLIRGREYFRENGGAIGDFEVGGLVCAVGALRAAHTGDPRDFTGTTFEVGLLNDAAKKLEYGHCVADANDDFGLAAVLNCYNYAITTLEKSDG